MVKRVHPVQPLVRDHQGVIRFKENKMVSFLLDWAQGKGMGLNEMACMNFPREDWQQFAQLIGYSLSGYSELSYVTDLAYKKAASQPKPRTKAKRPTPSTRVDKR